MAYSQAAILGVSLSFPVLGLMLVGVRFWMRCKLQKVSLGLDDWTILFAAVVVMAMNIDSILGSYVGTTGMHVHEITPARQAAQTKLNYAMLVIEKPAYGAIKLSVLFFYRRIFSLGALRTVNDWLIALIVAWTLAFWLVDILDCGAHPEANWNPALASTTYCINLVAMLRAFAVTDVVTDMAIMWIPYPQIKKLRMDLKERWAIAGVFLLGTIDLLIGIVRMSFVIANQTVPAALPTFWTVVEVSIGVIAADLPALAPLFRQRAKLKLLASSFWHRRITRSGNAAPCHGDMTIVDMELGRDSDLSDGGKIPADTAHARIESIGTWDQFERIHSLDAGD